LYSSQTKKRFFFNNLDFFFVYLRLPLEQKAHLRDEVSIRKKDPKQKYFSPSLKEK
jgi:hypothetical protein